jgi:glycerophosphoryl diester phosphodiesterase
MIIGHRGAGNLAPENSLESLKLAIKLRLHAVELDVQLTKDKKFVLSHNETFPYKGKQVIIAEKTQKALLRKGLVTLEEALDTCKDIIVIIDIKNWDSAQYLVPLVSRRKQVVRFTGSHVPDIEYCKQHAPRLFAYISENKNPLRVIKRADMINADGLSLKWFIINPLTYWQAKRRGLEIMLYTLNSRFICRLLAFLYPQISICTDRPDRLIGRRYNW